MKHRHFLIYVILMALLPFSLFSESFSGKCVGVSDGDTLKVMRDGKAVKVRLDGVDCPEKIQDYGSKAKQFTSSMVFGKEIHVEVKTIDRYGRIVGRVSVEGKDLSLEIISAGMGWHYKQYNNEPGLSSAEETAKLNKIGLWSMPNPTPPWEFRHGDIKATEKAPNEEIKKPVSIGVYITRTGAKYHRAGCGSLSRSMIPISLQDAKSRGYSPCKRCNPPE